MNFQADIGLSLTAGILEACCPRTYVYVRRALESVASRSGQWQWPAKPRLHNSRIECPAIQRKLCPLALVREFELQHDSALVIGVAPKCHSQHTAKWLAFGGNIVEHVLKLGGAVLLREHLGIQHV